MYASDADGTYPQLRIPDSSASIIDQHCIQVQMNTVSVITDRLAFDASQSKQKQTGIVIVVVDKFL